MSDLPTPGGQPDPGTWNPPVPGSTWNPTESTAPPPPPPTSTPLDLSPVTVSPKASGRKRAVAIGGAAALLVAGGFAVSAMRSGSSGGAGSPQDAISQLVESINDEDLLGAMDLLVPGERRLFKQPMVDFVDELKRLELLDTKATLGKLGGLDVEITLDSTKVDSVDDDLAMVELSGTAEMSAEMDKLPVGKFLVDQFMDGEAPSGSDSQTSSFGGDEGDAPKFATIKQDGRWYVSLFFTIGELARMEAGVDMPKQSEAIDPIGAASPERAVEGMVGALEDFDLEDIIARLNPGEAAALQRYAPLFLNEGQQEVDGFVDDGDVRLDIGTLELSAKTDGDVARVHVDKLVARAGAGDQAAKVTFADGCTSAEVNGQDPIKTCVDDATDQLDGTEFESIAKLIPTDYTIQTVKVDGEWYVSVLGSFSDVLLGVLRKVEQSDIEKMTEGISDLAGGVTTEIGGLDPTFDTIPFTPVPSTDAPLVLPTEPTGTDPVTSDAPSSSTPVVDAGVVMYDCVSSSDATPESIAACLQAAVDAGQITPEDIPIELRYPECGLAGYYSGSLFTMADAEFIATIQTAHDCFAGLVASGELTEDEVPSEVWKPECYQGINPWTLSGDQASEAITDLYTCIFA